MKRGTPRRLWASMLGVAGIVSACASIMSIEEPERRGPIARDGAPSREDGDTDSGCVGESCACQDDQSCQAPYGKCVANRCVECTTAPNDSCPKNSYCLAKNNTCATGCKANVDCAELTAGIAPLCNLERHQCVSCVQPSDCEGGKTCSPGGTCTTTCTEDDPDACNGPGEQMCCNGLCVDVLSDVFNCNACGTACSTANGAAVCAVGQCNWLCDPGYAHCAPGNTGCETNTATSAAQCGSCTNDCAVSLENAIGPACSASSCNYAVCKTGFANCDGDRTNGCECTCGGTGDRCCPNQQCFAKNDRCGANGRCQNCLGKGSSCSSQNNACCNACNGGKCT